MRGWLCLKVFLVMVAAVLPVQAQVCDPEADVRGELQLDSVGRPRLATVRNLSSACQYRVGLASYKVISDGVDHIESQILYDARERELLPGEEISLSVNVPPCAFQIDLFYGEHVPSFRGGVRYGTRKIAAALHDMTNLCPEPDCEETRVRDLRAALNFLPETDPRCGTVTNFSPHCTYDVGIAAYEMYDLPPIFNTQRLFDSQVSDSQPESTIEICVDVPECAYQLDMFHGPVLPVLVNGESYGTRLMAAGNFISPSRPLCADPPECAISVSGSGAICGRDTSRFGLTVPDASAELDIRWGTTCSAGAFSNPTARDTELSVPTPWGATPLDCMVNVTVRDTDSGLESSCSQPVRCVPEELPDLRCALDGSSSAVACRGVESDYPLQLESSGSVDATEVSWQSTCGDRLTFVNAGLSGATARVAAGAEGPACSVQATVIEPQTGRTAQCVKEITFGGCTRDCRGTVDGTATVDRCNVCDGDGQSCVPSCATLDISARLLSLDGAANAYRAIIDAMARELLRGKPRPIVQRLVRKARELARRLYLDAWTAIWSISRVQLQCDLSPFCVVVSNVEQTTIYRENVRKLQEVARSLERRLQANSRKRISRRIASLAKLVEGELAAIPTQQSVCP